MKNPELLTIFASLEAYHKRQAWCSHCDSVERDPCMQCLLNKAFRKLARWLCRMGLDGEALHWIKLALCEVREHKQVTGLKLVTIFAPLLEACEKREQLIHLATRQALCGFQTFEREDLRIRAQRSQALRELVRWLCWKGLGNEMLHWIQQERHKISERLQKLEKEASDTPTEIKVVQQDKNDVANREKKTESMS